MPDYAMCRDELCPSRMQCLRFTAVVKPDGWQSYAVFNHKDQDKCESFMNKDVPAGRRAKNK